MSIQRLALKMEFPPASVEVTAHRLTLSSKLTGSAEGVAVVCFDARYASVQWRGAPRLTRLHAPPTTWKVLDLALPHLEPGQPAPEELAELLSEGRQLDVVCASVHPITAAPFDMVTALDALSGESTQL